MQENANMALGPQTQERGIERIKKYMLSPEVKARFTDMMGPSAIYYLNQVMIVVANSSELQKCEPSSLFVSAMRAASLKLSVDTSQGQAWIIPYNGKATLQIGYKGIYELAMRTRQYRFINVIAIYEGEWLEENRMTGMHTIKGKATSAKVIARMLYFQLINGFEKTFVMTVEQIEAHAKHYSQGYRNPKSKWHDPVERPKMEDKTVLSNGLRKWGRFNQADEDLLNTIESEGWQDRAGNIPGEWEVSDPGPDKSATGQAYQDMSESQILGDLTGERPAKTEAPAEQSKAEAPAPEVSDLRMKPEALKDALTAKAKTMTGKVTPAQKGLIATTLEAALGTPDPKAARKQLLRYLTGHDSLTELNDAVLLSVYAWLKPYQDTASGEWFCDDMAGREARAALVACQPPQAELFN